MRNMTAFHPLQRHELLKAAPSIFAESGNHKTSAKYQHISTIQVVDALEKEGYLPVKVDQSRSRIEEKKGFAKHCIRFRHCDLKPTVDSGLFPELVLTNSHDGLSSYKLQSGLFRLVCSNGMVAGETHREVRVRHQGDIINQVIEGTYEVMQDSQSLLENAAEMGALELTNEERKIFAEAAHEIYFDGSESPLKNAISPEYFLAPKRFEDRKTDLFTTFNVVQENAIRGGLKGWYRDDNRRIHNVSTRAVNSIDRSNSLNRALFTLAEKMRELKN